MKVTFFMRNLVKFSTFKKAILSTALRNVKLKLSFNLNAI